MNLIFNLNLLNYQRVQVYAGVTYDREGHPAPTAQGRLCEWVEDPALQADSFSSFGAYQRTLKLHCEEGEPSILQWTPDQDTPDTVYYQVKRTTICLIC